MLSTGGDLWLGGGAGMHTRALGYNMEIKKGTREPWTAWCLGLARIQGQFPMAGQHAQTR